MGFSLSVSGFFEFITRPFHSIIGWIFIIAVVAYIIWRLKTGQPLNFLGGGRGGSGGGGGSRPDYIIK